MAAPSSAIPRLLPLPRAPLRTVVRAFPENAETVPEALAMPVTPAGAHDVRSSVPPPAHAPARHRLDIGGAVARPMSLSLASLKARPRRDLLVTMECAGNGRVALAPLPRGEPWARGAVSTAVWTGVPLTDLLDEAGVRDDAVEIVVAGADRGRPDGHEHEIAFERSLPLEMARHPSVLVAYAMNGAPLPPEHGAPVRLVVPGWYGVASVKWLAQVKVVTTPFEGWFQASRYVYERAGRPAEPVSTMRVKSMIVTPGEHAPARRGTVAVRGWAWSGEAPIQHVEVILDGGPPVAARLGPMLGRHAWRGFDVEVEITEAGRHSLRARARDGAGRVQPEVPEWNGLGYGMNAATAVLFDVV